MINRLSHATIWVLDQDEALAFYRDKLGFEVRTDQTMDRLPLADGRPAGAAGPRAHPARTPARRDVARGRRADQGAGREGRDSGSGVFGTDDCRGTYAELSQKGVEFLQEPAERFYGVEAMFRDNSGNWFSLTQRSN